MYQGREDLQLLIDSLTSGEKRYLSNIFKSSNEDAGYLDLYNSIKNSQSGVQSIESEPKGRVKIDLKRMLYKIILRHLRQMHRELSTDILIQNALTDIEILYEHSLPEQAMLILSRTKKLAGEHERFGLYLQVLQWEQRLSIVSERPARPIEEIRREEEEMLVKSIQINRLIGLYHQVLHMKKTYGFVQGEVRDRLERLIIESPDLPSEQDCQSIKARFYRNLIFSIYHWMIFEHDRAFVYSSKLQEHKSRIILPEDYLNGLFQHITSSVCLMKFKDAINGIELARTHMEAYNLNQSVPRQQYFFAYNATYHLIINNYTGNKTELASLIKETELRLKYWEKTLPIEQKQGVLGNLMNAHMAIGAMDSAEAIWNQLFTHQSKRIRQDIYGDLFVFRIFFLIHNYRYDLIQTVAKSAIRFYEAKIDRMERFIFEDRLAQLFVKPLNWEDKTFREVTLEQAQRMIRDYIFVMTGTIGFQEHYSRYEIWCDAILYDEPYYNAAQKWYAKKTNS